MTETLRHSRYDPGEVLGRGAQGLVLRVRDREAPTRVLVAKVYSAGRFDPALLAGEFALLSRLRIPGVVRAHDFGRDEATGAPFLVEDFVDGPEASDWLARVAEGPARVRRLADLIAHTATSLAALHEAGFVHADLKPAHVRIASNGRATLLDLGAAVLRGGDQGAIGITHAFAAPEVIAGAPPSPASDLFSLGATLCAVIAGQPQRTLTREVAWVPPSIATLIEQLLREHPRDRPHDAREILADLGRSFPTAPASHVESLGLLVGRRRELARVLGARERVVVVSGNAGIGKSHLLREAHTELLLAGQSTRLVSFPCDDSALVQRLIAYFRGANAAWPFATHADDFVLVLDDLERAPDDLRAALDAYRCRVDHADRVRVLVGAREAPVGSASIALGPIDEESARALAAPFCPESDLDTVLDLARGNPGVIVAAVGRIPLEVDAARAHVAGVSAPARDLLGAIAIAGGELPSSVCAALAGAGARAVFAELQGAALVVRRRRDAAALEMTFALPAVGLAPDLAAALGTFEVADALADQLLGSSAAPAELLARAAAAPNPPAHRRELLALAAQRAKSEGLRSIELDVLLSLAADAAERTPELLVELDRITRGGGSSGLHPELVQWLEAASDRTPELATLALRRRAEVQARAGSFDVALELVERARAVAVARRDPWGEGLALAMHGAVELYRARWSTAEGLLERARSLLAGETSADPEEIARLDHNFGVVALYRGRTDDAIAAFERSLAAKRRMGDRGGIWTCLLNLALATARRGHFDRARIALDEAGALTRSLGQTEGTAWCWVARADVEVRSGDARAAERWLAEARAALESPSPALVADLALTAAEVALLDHDPLRSVDALASLDQSERSEDALCDTRALVLEARAALASLPVDRRRAARLLVRAIRRARTAELVETENQALELLRQLRGRSDRLATSPKSSYDVVVAADEEAWRLVEQLGRGLDLAAAALELCRLVVKQSGAERAFIVVVADSGKQAWGADVDGLAVAQSAQRVAGDLIEQALERATPVYRPRVETAGGQGSQLAVADADAGGARGVVVAEHRFVPARFDHVTEGDAQRWATLAQLIARLTGTKPGASVPEPVPVERTMAPSPAGPPETTTALPLARPRRAFGSIVGKSAALGAALVRLEAAVDSGLPLLILGETGVGKELFARAVHDHGPRSDRPFVAVSCAAIPDTLFEAELFGHAKGSFTGADKSRLGLLARAEGGTLLLDEIGELPLTRQATLLRALESKNYRPVGADAERPFDVRIVAATNSDLGAAVERGEFRRDLLYRLNVLEVRIPALRERSEDVVPLVRHFLESESGGRAVDLSEETMAALERHSWPGNVRELEHCVQRLIASGVRRVELKHLPREIRAAASKPRPSARSQRAPRPTGVDAERDQVARALETAKGNITHAAAALGLTRHGLKKKMLRLGMRAMAGTGQSGGASDRAGTGAAEPAVHSSSSRATPSRAKS